MPHILKNANIELRVDIPSENYQLARFDWTGKITALRYKGRRMSSAEQADTEVHPSCGRGFYNEFGFDAPVGFEEAEIGGWFHKIGIGLLKKTEAPYKFNIAYEIQAATFDIDATQESVRIICQSANINGYAYWLQKEIQLLPSGFLIRYCLENTGSKRIRTNEYCHNFLALDGRSIGSDYVLKFPFQIKPALFGENVNLEGLVNVGPQQFTFQGTPEQPFYFSNLSGNEPVNAHWELIHSKSKIGISETGNFRSQTVNLWGWRHVISPELFVDVDVDVGGMKKWERVYRVFEIEQVKNHKSWVGGL